MQQKTSSKHVAWLRIAFILMYNVANTRHHVEWAKAISNNDDYDVV